MNNIDKKIDNDIHFFENNIFFDNKVKQKIQKYANVKFEDLAKWCSLMFLTRPQQVEYIGNKEYVKFFMSFIFRQKEIINNLWNISGNILDKSFKKSIISNREHFTGYFWELFLISFFAINQLSISKNKRNKGPDIKIEYSNQTFWIECICPKCGNNNYKVPEMEFNNALSLPIDKIEERLKNALKCKTGIYRDYINKNIISPSDKKIIAINTGDLSQYGNLIDVQELAIVSLARRINFFENNKEIDGLIYSHTSIFNFTNTIRLFIIKNDYSIQKVECKI